MAMLDWEEGRTYEDSAQARRCALYRKMFPWPSKPRYA